MPDQNAETTTFYAYAKINLSLEILGRRADGYHNLTGVMQTVSLADTLTVEAAPPGTLTVESSRYQGKYLVVAFEGVHDRNDAEALRDTLVSVDRSTLPGR